MNYDPLSTSTLEGAQYHGNQLFKEVFPIFIILIDVISTVLVSLENRHVVTNIYLYTLKLVSGHTISISKDTTGFILRNYFNGIAFSWNPTLSIKHA